MNQRKWFAHLCPYKHIFVTFKSLTHSMIKWIWAKKEENLPPDLADKTNCCDMSLFHH